MLTRRIRVAAPAKVNLCLAVGARRDDGYHSVDTVLHCLSLADEVTVAPADSLSLACLPSVGIPDDRNLAYKAAVAFSEKTGLDSRVAIRVDKRIPPGAGLAGGSSDAAAVIAALAHLHGIERTDPRCLAAAARLGADVAFFLHGAAALMTGRGEEFVRFLPALDVPIVLVKPPLPVPTGAAYAAFDASPQESIGCAGVVDALTEGDPLALAASLANNLEVASASVVPEVAVTLAWMRAQEGVTGALLAGSGSAVFALLEAPSTADMLVAGARERGWWAMTASLSSAGLELADEGQAE